MQQDMEEARAYCQDIKARAVKCGRIADAVKVMPGLMPVLGASAKEAEEKLQRIQDFIHPELGIARLSSILGTDLSGFDPDRPLPDLAEGLEQPGRQQVVIQMARRENLTIRQLYERVVGIRAHRVVAGTAEEIADDMEAWHKAGAADGFKVWSGNDNETFYIMAMGGYGVVSVASHLIGNQIKHMMGLLLEGDVEGAAAEHRRLLPLFKVLFVESNPIPVKWSVNKVGFKAGNVRLPLVLPQEETVAELKRVLADYRMDLPV